MVRSDRSSLLILLFLGLGPSVMKAIETKAKQNKANSVRATLIGLVGSTSSKASPTILYG